MCAPLSAAADKLRVAVFDTELAARGPGLMLRDIRRGSPKSRSGAALIAKIKPDIILVLGVDYDHDLQGLAALQQAIAEHGHTLPVRFALPTNRGDQSGIDLNGDGWSNGAEDAFGFGHFFGQGSMAILSRWPVSREGVKDFSHLLWKDLPGARLPFVDGRPFPSEAAQSVQRLSSGGHWIVPIETPAGDLQMLTLDATPPVFDGEEDRNGLRNADELRLWQHVLNGGFGGVTNEQFILLGNANQDIQKGEGQKGALRALLNHPRLQDPHPVSRLRGDITADWPDPTPGDMRVDYILPSSAFTVLDKGVAWPEGEETSRHALIWVDLAM